MGSKAGKVERLFNNTTRLNLHVTLKDPSGVLTQLSPDHSMTVYTQSQDKEHFSITKSTLRVQRWVSEVLPSY